MRRLITFLIVAWLAIPCPAVEVTKSDPPSTSKVDAKSLTPDSSKTNTATPKIPAKKSAEKPLLLLDDDTESTPEKGAVADNSRCQVCHLNLIKEELALTHARANIGCAKCHGASEAHIADESWASGGNGTAPDIMFPKDKISAACWKCHPKDKLDPDHHQEFLAGSTKEKYCVDCHGKHRLFNRKCKWK